MNINLIEGISCVKSSKNRCKILNIIGNSMKTPSEISKESGIRLNHVSLYLSELKKSELVECLNENAKKGRLYHLTNLGENVFETIK